MEKQDNVTVKHHRVLGTPKHFKTKPTGRPPKYDYSAMPPTLTREQVYNIMGNAFRRCMDTINYPQYEDCAVCTEWQLDRQSFIDWICKNYYTVPTNEQIDLDKDILVKGNRIYSPKTCCFVPHSINLEFQTNNIYPMPMRRDDGKYQITDNRCKVFIGVNFDDAIQKYIDHRKKELANLAEKYKDMIPNNVYEAIKYRELTIDDWDFRLFDEPHYTNEYSYSAM